MKQIIFLIVFFCSHLVQGQELYVYTEPASNIPARSLSGKLSSIFMERKRNTEDRFMQRYTPELMFGINKKWMVRVNGTFSNMHTKRLRWESVYLYGKYRFLSRDELHSHFRMAAFADATYARSDFHYDEVNLPGDNSGVQLGLIATQLWNKLAISGTVSHTQVLDKSRNSKRIIYIPSRIYQVMNYSFSAGYLILPLEYTDYKQTNLNVYTELLAQQSLDRKVYFADLATAVQLIFNSNAKLNMGYRFQLKGDMLRMSNNSWLVSFERTFLNVLKKKKN